MSRVDRLERKVDHQNIKVRVERQLDHQNIKIHSLGKALLHLKKTSVSTKASPKKKAYARKAKVLKAKAKKAIAKGKKAVAKAKKVLASGSASASKRRAAKK